MNTKEFIMQIEFLTALKNLRLAAGVLHGASQTAMMGLLILLHYDGVVDLAQVH